MFDFQIIDLASWFQSYTEEMPAAEGTAEGEESVDQLVTEYIDQMTEQQRKVMDIALDHLQSSFSVVKSIGFKQWIATRKGRGE
tara:strand:+ start:108 stop:359 length:252 start_codon:yes stop_codon:yes gene_type:complete